MPDNISSKPHGYVYLMEMGGFYKIGASLDPKQRLKAFSTLPWPARIAHQIATKRPRALERALHQRFAARRRNGEWFKLLEGEVRALLALDLCDDPLNLPPFLTPKQDKKAARTLRDRLAVWIIKMERQTEAVEARRVLQALRDDFFKGGKSFPSITVSVAGRKATWPPKMHHHKLSGRARIRIAGRDIYLGPWGSEEAQRNYEIVVAEHGSVHRPAPRMTHKNGT